MRTLRYTGCRGGPATLTHLGFSYSARVEVTDAYEWAPHSNGYYHSTATYWANGLLDTLSGPGLTTLYYCPDGERRASSVRTSGCSGTALASGARYNVFSEATAVTYGSGDSDSFSYDVNTGHMTQYQYTVNGSSVVANLTWNANGSLRTLAITDPFNSANQQTCNYGYEDLARIGSVSCNHWTQTFSLDAFGNIDKTGSSGATSFLPTYSGARNHMTALGGLTPTYDANGNLTYDTYHTYTWDAESHVVTISPNPSVAYTPWDDGRRTTWAAVTARWFMIRWGTA